MTVFILLPVHNRVEKTIRFVQDLARQDNGNFLLILLDDGSADGTAERCRASLGSRITVVQGQGRWWWGGALAVGLSHLARQRPAETSYAVGTLA